MGIVPALALIAVALLAWKSGALAQLGVPAPIAASINGPPSGLQPNVSVTAPPSLSPVPVSPSGPTLGRINAFSPGGGPSGGISGSTVSAVGTSIAASGQGFLAGGPIGAVVAGVTSLLTSLAAGHALRTKQATDENTAMNLGVKGYDQGLAQVNAAYVARQISASDAIKLVQQIMSYYWQEVTPHIQPGRNGCQGGASCPPYKGCSGSIGAACCVGCYDLIGGSTPSNFPPYGSMYFGVLGTIAVLQNGGGPVYYQAVIGSKYGGQARPAYVLNWVQGAVA